MPNLNLATGCYSLATWTTGDGANPTAAETLTIGSQTYRFGAGAVPPVIDVAIAGTLAGTIDNLITAIEANTTSAIEVWREGNVLFLMVYDDDAEDYVIAGTLPALANSQVLDPWASYTGKTGGGRVAQGTLTMTNALVARPFDIKVPFNVAGGFFQWTDATGTIRSTISATITLSGTGSGVTIDPTAGGVLPVATNVLTWILFE